MIPLFAAFYQETGHYTTPTTALLTPSLINLANDTVILFVAGHGMIDDKQNYYFVTHDMDLKTPSQSGVKFMEFENLLEGIRARKKLLLVDTCFSGESEAKETIVGKALDNNSNVKVRAFIDKRGITVKAKETFRMNVLQEELFNDLRQGTGAIVVSSSSGDEYSFEGEEWKNGVFTYSILEALKMKRADSNRDKKITVSELRDYVSDRVKQLTLGGQNPTTRRDNIDNDFTIYE